MGFIQLLAIVRIINLFGFKISILTNAQKYMAPSGQGKAIVDKVHGHGKGLGSDKNEEAEELKRKLPNISESNSPFNRSKIKFIGFDHCTINSNNMHAKFFLSYNLLQILHIA